MFKKFALIAFLLSLTLTACPQPIEPPATQPPITQPPTSGPTLQLGGSVSPWTRGARVLKTTLTDAGGTLLTTFRGTLNADGSFALRLEEPNPNTLFAFNAPSGCGSGFSVTPPSMRGNAITSLSVLTSAGLQSGTLTRTNSVGTPAAAGNKFAAFVYSDQDAVIVADCPAAGGGIAIKINWTLKRGWNTLLVEFLAGNVVRYSNDLIPSDVVWQFIPSSGASITINNAPATLETGQSVSLNATLKEPDGTPVEVGQNLTWTSSDPTIASVDSAGRLTAKRLGSVQISATVPNAGSAGATFLLNVYGLEVSGGTYNLNDQKLGVAAKVRYVAANGQSATQPLDLRLSGPPGWNGGQALALTGTLAALQQGGYQSPYQSIATEAAAISGTYTVRLENAPVVLMTASNRVKAGSFIFPTQAVQFPRVVTVAPIRAQADDGATATFTVDATKKWETVRNLRFSTDASNNVQILWEATQFGAFVYEYEVFDQTDAKLVAPRRTAYGTSGYLNAITLDKTHIYQLRVFSFQDDYNLGMASYNVSQTTVVQDFRPFVTQTDAAGGLKSGGYTLTLYGQNFDADTKVFFGATEVTTKTIQNTAQMQIVVPAATLGTVEITLKDNNGFSSAAATQSFRYYEAAEFDAKYPTHLLAGADGAVYFIEYDFSLSTPMSLAKISSSGAITRISLPTLNSNSVQDTALDSSGRVWIATADRAIRVNANNSLTEVAYPSGVQAAMIAFGADGNLWIARSDAYKITRIKPDGTAPVDFPLIGNGSSFNQNYDFLLGPDGNLWLTSPSGLGRITPAGAITTFSQQSVGNLIVAGTTLWASSYSGLTRLATDGTATFYPQSCSGRFAAGPSNTFWCAGGPNLSGSNRLFVTTLGTGTSSVTRTIIVGSGSNYNTASSVVADSNGKIWYVIGTKIGVITP